MLATKGLPKGGDHIDLLLERYLFPELGKGVKWSRRIDGSGLKLIFLSRSLRVCYSIGCYLYAEPESLSFEDQRLHDG